MSKCMEFCVYKYMHNFLLDNAVITPYQSGFTQGDSVINQLLNISNEIGRALDYGKEFRVISVKLFIVFGTEDLFSKFKKKMASLGTF